MKESKEELLKFFKEITSDFTNMEALDVMFSSEISLAIKNILWTLEGCSYNGPDMDRRLKEVDKRLNVYMSIKEIIPLIEERIQMHSRLKECLEKLQDNLLNPPQN